MMRTFRGRGFWVSSLVLVSGCSSAPPARVPELARVAVEILGGGLPVAVATSRVVLVLDASASMTGPAAPRVSRLAAAQVRARELLRSLPPETRVSIEALGLAASDRCGPAESLARVSTPADVDADVLDEIAGGGDGSLAAALETIAATLSRERVADAARVVAFSDLEDLCGGDLCGAVKAVVDAGAALDLVVLGGRSTPECVDSVAGPIGAPPGMSAPAPVRFRVYPAGGAPVDGSTGTGTVAVPAGAARIELALEPPLEVGPLTLAPGAMARVRVLDFPGARPPVREWSLEVVGSGGSLADAAPPEPAVRP